MDKEMFCTSCRLRFPSLTDYKMHIIKEFHIYNTKRRAAQLPPISEEIFEDKRLGTFFFCLSLRFHCVPLTSCVFRGDFLCFLCGW